MAQVKEIEISISKSLSINYNTIKVTQGVVVALEPGEDVAVAFKTYTQALKDQVNKELKVKPPEVKPETKDEAPK